MRKNFKLLPDNELVALFKNGEEEAFNEIFKRYYNKLKNFICAMSKHTFLSEDIVQDTFINASNAIKKGQYRGEGLSAWLYKIARNKFLDYARDQKFYLPIENCLNLKITNSPSLLLEGKEKMEMIYKISKTLTKKQELAVNLRVQDVSLKDIKLITGIDKNYVWTIMKMTRHILDSIK